MKLGTVKKTTPLYEQIYQTLKEDIIKGVYEAGDRISETKIAKDLGVSRSPVREAVHALLKEGLLLQEGNSYLKVYKPNAKDVIDIYECRIALGGLATKLTTRRASQKQIDGIGKIVSEIQCNSPFHYEIIKACQNPRVQKQLEDLRTLTSYLRARSILREGRRDEITREHNEIFKSINARDENKARKLMEEHIQNDLEYSKPLL